MKILKWLLIGLSGIAAVLIAATLWLLFGLDPNSFKSEIERLAAQQNVELKIDGQLNWTLWPEIALEIGATTLSAPDYGITQLSWQEAQLHLDKMALLQRNILFNSISIDQADMEAVSAADAGSAALAPAAANDLPQTADSSSRFSLAVERFSLTNSRIKVIDPESADKTTLVTVQELTTRQLNFTGEEFPVRFNIAAQINNLSPLHITGDTEFTANLEQKKFSFVSNNITFSYDNLPALKISFTGNFDGGSDRLDLDNMTLAGQGINAEVSVAVQALSSAPTAQGSLTVSSDNLSELLASLNLADSAPPVKRLAGRADFQATTDKATFNSFTLNLDDYSLKGSGYFQLAPTRDLELLVTASALDLDKFTSADTQEQVSASNGEELLAPLLAPLALLEGGKGRIEFTAPSITSSGIMVQQLRLNLSANNNVLHISELSGKVFDGQFQATGRIDFRSNTPDISIEKHLQKINLGKVMATLAESQDFQGILDLDFTGTSKGATLDAIRTQAKGQGSLTISEPAVNNLNIEQTICELAARINPKYGVEKTWPQQTRLNPATGKFQLNGNTLTLQTLATGVGNINVNATGTLEIEKQYINLLAVTRLTQEKTSAEGCTVTSKLVNQEIPLQCAGSFAEDGKLGCQPEKKWLNQFVQNILIKELQQQFLKKEQPKETTEDATDSEEVKQPKSTKEEALDTLLRGIFKK